MASGAASKPRRVILAMRASFLVGNILHVKGFKLARQGAGAILRQAGSARKSDKIGAKREQITAAMSLSAIASPDLRTPSSSDRSVARLHLVVLGVIGA